MVISLFPVLSFRQTPLGHPVATLVSYGRLRSFPALMTIQSVFPLKQRPTALLEWTFLLTLIGNVSRRKSRLTNGALLGPRPKVFTRLMTRTCPIRLNRVQKVTVLRGACRTLLPALQLFLARWISPPLTKLTVG